MYSRKHTNTHAFTREKQIIFNVKLTTVQKIKWENSQDKYTIRRHRSIFLKKKEINTTIHESVRWGEQDNDQMVVSRGKKWFVLIKEKNYD